MYSVKDLLMNVGDQFSKDEVSILPVIIDASLGLYIDSSLYKRKHPESANLRPVFEL